MQLKETEKKSIPEIPIEHESAPEQSREQLSVPEAPHEHEEKKPAQETDLPGPPPARRTPPVSQPLKTPELEQIEKILEQDLHDMFVKLSPAEQLAFKTKGEQAAEKIDQALRKAKVRVKDIIKIIADWLKTLPGVNAFFVEQEAKIKAQKIIQLKR